MVPFDHIASMLPLLSLALVVVFVLAAPKG